MAPRAINQSANSVGEVGAERTEEQMSETEAERWELKRTGPQELNDELCPPPHPHLQSLASTARFTSLDTYRAVSSFRRRTRAEPLSPETRLVNGHDLGQLEPWILGRRSSSSGEMCAVRKHETTRALARRSGR